MTRILLILLALLPSIVSCADGEVDAEEPTPTSSAAADYDRIVRRLNFRGIDVTQIGEAFMPCFGVRPNILLVRDGTVEIYEYPDAAAAADIASKIFPGAFEAIFTSVGKAPSGPHFYLHQSLLVVYRGTDLGVESALESILGPPFAGGVSAMRC